MKIFDEINRMSRGSNSFAKLYENKRYKLMKDREGNWYTNAEEEAQRKQEAREDGPMGKYKPGKIEKLGKGYMFLHNGVHYTFNTLEDAKRERVLLGRLVPHYGYGRHIKVAADDGEYSTKNIAPFGARTLFDADDIHGKGRPVDLDLRKPQKKY